MIRDTFNNLVENLTRIYFQGRAIVNSSSFSDTSPNLILILIQLSEPIFDKLLILNLDRNSADTNDMLLERVTNDLNLRFITESRI
jgi:hypothetical protein